MYQVEHLKCTQFWCNIAQNVRDTKVKSTCFGWARHQITAYQPHTFYINVITEATSIRPLFVLPAFMSRPHNVGVVSVISVATALSSQQVSSECWPMANVSKTIYVGHPPGEEGPSIVVKALRYKSVGPGIDSNRWRFVFILWQLTFPCALGSTQTLKLSTRIFLGVKAAGV